MRIVENKVCQAKTVAKINKQWQTNALKPTVKHPEVSQVTKQWLASADHAGPVALITAKLKVLITNSVRWR